MLFQNGLGIEQPLAAAYPHIPIVSVSIWVGANYVRPSAPGKTAKVTHGLLEKLIMGLYTGEGGSTGSDVEHSEGDILSDPHGYRKGPEGQERLDEGGRRAKIFADLISNGGGTAELVENIQARRIEKKCVAFSPFAFLPH